MTPLEPCPHCHRHVHITETACPFCAGALADAFAHLAARALPTARIGRAAMFAFGALGAAASGCGDNVARAPDAAQLDAGHDAAIDSGGVPIYAAAPTPDPPTRG